jgi:hypothetical protein
MPIALRRLTGWVMVAPGLARVDAAPRSGSELRRTCEPPVRQLCDASHLTLAFRTALSAESVIDPESMVGSAFHPLAVFMWAMGC